MKKSLKITTGLLSLVMLTACAPADKAADNGSEKNVVFESEETTQTEATADIDQQFDLIVNNYDEMRNGYPYYEDVADMIYVAVADLNHNGRLEMFFTTTQGSGAFSYTVVFEVSEDCTKMERLNSSSGEKYDEAGDFLISMDTDTNVAVYNCYKKDGEYYYQLRDYASAGWPYKLMGFYAYSFAGQVKRDPIGGISVTVDESEDKIAKIWLSDADGKLFLDGDAFEAYMTGYWSEFEQHKSCEVRWVRLSDITDVRAAAEESWNAFNPESELVDEFSYSYKDVFGGFYDDYGFVVQDSE